MKNNIKAMAMQNGPLAKLIAQTQNPYYSMHIERAFKLKNPTIQFKDPGQAALGNPWLNFAKVKK